MQWLRMRTWVPVGVSVVAAAVLIGYAINAPAFPLRDVELHDSGIWVTNNADDVYGRINLTAGGIDGYLTPGATRSGNLDIFQDGATVMARDVASGRLIPVNPATVANVVDSIVPAAPDDHIALGAGSIAALDAKTGSLRIARYAPDAVPDLSALDPSADPFADLGVPPADVPASDASAVAIGVDGTVYALSTSGTAYTIHPAGAYGFAAPVTTPIAAGLKGVRATAVGDQLVYLDPTTGVVSLPGGMSATLPDGAGSVLQMPGPASTVVFAATRTAWYVIPLGGGDPVEKTIGDAGVPASPVVVRGVAYAAWSGDPARLVATPADGSGEATPLALDRDQTLITPVFRVNHDRVVLNDMDNGLVFDVEAMRSLDNWAQVRTPDSGKDVSPNDQQQESQPAAAPDDLGARPGRTSVLHVLDNDKDPGGNVLAITAVDAPAVGSSATISADGQTILLTTDANMAPQSFSYTVSNGTGEAAGQVTVAIRGDGENGPPILREGYAPVVYPVIAGGSIPIYAALDWRDPDSDPVSIVAANVDGTPLPVTPAGAILYTAPRIEQDTVKTIDYTVSDGHPGVEVAGKVAVRVIAATATQGVPPIAEADLIRAQVGKPAYAYPLANDVPGVDPLNPTAGLTLASSVASPTGLTVVTDLTSGLVTITAATAGTYYLDYTAAAGAAGYNTGRIRVDVSDRSSSEPLTAPDFVTVRGTVPATVDVLANDLDPDGSMLTVTSAEPENPDQIAVAVFAGRWIRVQPLGAALSPNPQVVHYTVTNGRSAPVQGDVTITQLAPPVPDRVMAFDDTAIVRSGDSVAVDVLANDASASGKMLLLDEHPDPSRPTGELPVLVIGSSAAGPTPTAQQAGQAFVAGNKIRYIAPSGVTEPLEVAIPYAAATAGGGSLASATLTVRVMPEPTDKAADAPPTPKPLEARVVSGGKATLPVPLYGVDPDGDSVTVVGIGSLPKQGRITAISPTSVVYEAFPDATNVGTDSFTYLVTDRYGQMGIATARIGLVSTATFPLSIAVDDTVTAQPGASVTVQPLVNDLVAAGDNPAVVPLDTELPAGVTLSTTDQIFSATAPEDGQPPVQFSYLLRGAGGDGTPAVVTVRSQPGYLNPPRLTDCVATVDGTTAGAAPLATAWDVDGPSESITLSSITAGTINPDGTVSGIPLTDHIQALPFTATDADGATSAAILFVPAAATGAPQLRPDVTQIDIAANSTKTVNLADYVFSPRDRDVRITVVNTLAAAPSYALSVQAASPTALTLTAQNDYVGPGAIGLEVTDGADATDPTGLRAYVTIPVQVGPPTPVLRCPPDPQTVVQGGNNRTIDITALCHVWTPAGGTALSYSADWATPLAGVTATGGRVVTLSAAGASVPGSESPLRVGIAGTQAPPATLTVKVIGAGKPTLSVPDLTDIQQGSSVGQRISLASPLRDAAPTVISVVQTGGAPCQISQIAGNHFTLTPGADTHGVMTFDVVASDLADPARTERQVRGSFQMTVFGRPDPPSPPAPGTQLLTHAVALSWSPGADNGAAIDEYQVQASDGRFAQSCGRMTMCNITGVPNGVPIAFQARAHNLAGWSEWSPPGPSFTPNEVPGVATGFTASDPQDKKLTLTWSPAPVDGTPLTAYHLAWSGGSTGGMDLPGDATSVTVDGLINDSVYEFKLTAANDVGPSLLTATTTGQSSGAPLGLVAPTVTPGDLGDVNQVTVAWPAADPNGPGPVTYQVTRTGGSAAAKTFAPTTALNLGDSIPYDGQTYTYAVTAVNGTGGPAHTSAPQQTTFVSIGAPVNWAPGSVSAAPNGQSGQIELTFTYPPSRGASSRVVIAWTGAATGSRTIGSLTPAGGSSSIIVPSLPNAVNLDATFQVCNENACNGNLARASGSAFGPLATPTLEKKMQSTNGDHGVCARAAGNGNGRDATLRLTATEPHGLNASKDVATGAAALGGTDWWCVDAGGGNRTVTFTAQLITAVTTPTRPDSASATATQRSPNDPPAPWASGSVRLTPTGVVGQLQLDLTYPDSNGNQARIEVTGPGGKQTITGLNPSGGTTSLTLNGLTNGQPASVQVLLCNEEVCSATPGDSPSATPFGPLSSPTISATPSATGGRQLCAHATADGNGADATLIVRADNGTASTPRVGPGGLTVDWCTDAGAPNKTLTFTAELTSNTTPSRPDPAAATAQATTPPDPPDAFGGGAITLSPTGQNGTVGAQVKYPACNGTACTVEVTWSGAASGSTGKVTADLGGGTWSGSITGATNGATLTVSAVVCNEKYCGSPSPTASAVAFGPLASPTVSASAGSPGDHKLCAHATGNGNGGSASLTISASNGASSPAQTGTGALTADWCTDAGGPSVTLTFTAHLTSNTTPARSEPTPATADAKTPLDPPSPWKPGAITLTPTGQDGGLSAQVIYPPCNGSACTVTVTWSGATSGSTTITATPAGGVWTNPFTGLPNGATLNVTAHVCNEQGSCNSESAAGSGSAFGPLAQPSINVYKHGGQGDHLICATASGNGNGRDAHIHLTQGGNAWDGATGSGAISIGAQCVDVGASGTATFSAQVITSATTPARGNSPSKSGSATTDPDPVVITLALGPTGTWSFCNTSACRSLVMNASGLAHSTTYTFNYVSDCAAGCGGTNPFITYSLTSDGNGSVSLSGEPMFGFTGTTVWVEVYLGSTLVGSSNRILWPA